MLRRSVSRHAARSFTRTDGDAIQSSVASFVVARRLTRRFVAAGSPAMVAFARRVLATFPGVSPPSTSRRAAHDARRSSPLAMTCTVPGVGPNVTVSVLSVPPVHRRHDECFVRVVMTPSGCARLAISVSLGALLLVACASRDASPLAPSSSAESCPRGTIATQADLDQTVYFLDMWCPRAPAQPPSRRSNDPRLQAIYASACVSGGSAFEAGRCGFPRDAGRALVYYRRGCAMGYPVACDAARRLGG